MHDGHIGADPAATLAELRRRLADAMAKGQLNQTQLAARAELGRTTVSEALSPKAPVPSAATVAAMARVLRLPVEELLELRRTGAGETDAASAEESGPGRAIQEWEPHELEVHPAGPVTGTSSADGVRALPGYVRRDHDSVLANAVAAAAAGLSGIVVLVGSSSTGKTRACWQAVQPLAQKGWRLWHPFDPTRAEAALEDLCRVRPRTVVWLNEAQHYFGDRKFGERIASAVHQLLIDKDRGPVLVLGTLWPEYAHDYTALPEPGKDPHSRVRELLAGHTVSVPDSFDTVALAAAKVLAEKGDALLADVLTRHRDGGRITQDLAGAPELLRRYEQPCWPAARALLEAAMDARRLGVGLHLSQAFLTDAAPDYLSDDDFDQLTDDWAEQAYAELAKQVHGKQAPLRRSTPRPQRRPPAPTTDADSTTLASAGAVFKLADYLEQHGRISRRHLCPPASFWHAAHTHFTNPDDLRNLAEEAEARHRRQWHSHLLQRAADRGDARALVRLAVLREEAGDRDGAEAVAGRAANHGSPEALMSLAELRKRAGDRDGAAALFRQAASHGNTNSLMGLAKLRQEVGDRYGAESLFQQAANHGDNWALMHLAIMREEAGDRDGAEALAWQADGNAKIEALMSLAMRREEAGDRDGAEALSRQAADNGHVSVLMRVALLRAEILEDRDGAEDLYQWAADRGHPSALVRLAVLREEAGDRDGAEILARQAVNHGRTEALTSLAALREEAGDRDGAEILARQAANHGNPSALVGLAMLREEAGDCDNTGALVRQLVSRGDIGGLTQLVKRWEEAGDREGAESLALQAADHGSTSALATLAVLREEAGDREAAESLARQAADHGSTSALATLAELRDEAGDREAAESLARQAADRGRSEVLVRLAMRREEAGDRDGAEALARQAADHGSRLIWLFAAGEAEFLMKLWPYGLDPDGMPTPRWH